MYIVNVEHSKLGIHISILWQDDWPINTDRQYQNRNSATHCQPLNSLYFHKISFQLIFIALKQKIKQRSISEGGNRQQIILEKCFLSHFRFDWITNQFTIVRIYTKWISEIIIIIVSTTEQAECMCVCARFYSTFGNQRKIIDKKQNKKKKKILRE